MVGFETELDDFQKMDVKVVAASVDPEEKAQEVANDASFPVGFGVTRDIADSLGSWWEDRRSIVQPSEFLVGPDNKVLTSSYSSGPIGRIDASDMIRYVTFLESRK